MNPTQEAVGRFRKEFHWHNCGIIDFESFLVKELSAAVEGERKKHIKFLERIMLEAEVCVCDCGEEWKDSYLFDLVKEELDNYSPTQKGQHERRRK